MEVARQAPEAAKKRRIADDEEDELMADAPAAEAVSEARANRAQPLPSVQEDFSPELLKM